MGPRSLGVLVVACCLAACSGDSSDSDGSTTHLDGSTTLDVATDVPDSGDPVSRSPRLDEIRHWLYLIDVNLEEATVESIVDSGHQMVVLDFILSEANNTDFPMADVVGRLHNAPTPKLVLAYVDIGQAEDFRTYWQPGWMPGDPEWIAGLDPDGWEGNYPVAFWWDEWRSIWLDDGGYIEAIVDSGFDGVYLDWVEAYSDPNVMEIADTDGIDARREMIWWVSDIAARGRQLDEEFIVVAQNAAELLDDDEYAAVIDGLAQEQVWFDGGADNDPPGDCPLPRLESDIDTPEYVESLSDRCRRQYEDFPDSTLHVSSEDYLEQLAVAAVRGLPVFTVDYALDPDNVERVTEMSRSLGYVPFVGSRALDGFVPVHE